MSSREELALAALHGTPTGYVLRSTSSRELFRGWKAEAWLEGKDGVIRCFRTVHVLDRWMIPRNRELARRCAELNTLVEYRRRTERPA